jgi:lysophospholipase L1-like esterase
MFERPYKKFRRDRDNRLFFRNLKKPGAINILVEGDSWFAYPLKTNVPQELFNIDKNYNFYRSDTSGHEMVQMISGPQKARLRDFLKKHGKSLDFILFSGGGNDILGVGLEELIAEKDDTNTTFNTIALKNRLFLLEYCYKELIILRDLYAPGVPIVTHTYDYPFISGHPIKIGPVKIGPWILPTLELKKWIVDNARKVFIFTLVNSFVDILKKLSNENKDFHFIDLRNTLETEDLWNDEIHPTEDGFKLISQKIDQKIKQLYLDNS